VLPREPAHPRPPSPATWRRYPALGRDRIASTAMDSDPDAERLASNAAAGGRPPAPAAACAGPAYSVAYKCACVTHGAAGVALQARGRWSRRYGASVGRLRSVPASILGPPSAHRPRRTECITRPQQTHRAPHTTAATPRAHQRLPQLPRRRPLRRGPQRPPHRPLCLASHARAARRAASASYRYDARPRRRHQ
jgi:hypothetical protein